MADERIPEDECLEYGRPDDPCSGEVHYLTIDGLSVWPRCEHHFQARLERYEHSLESEAMSPTPPPWYDPSYAGETWEE